jgi:hypothetical protein
MKLPSSPGLDRPWLHNARVQRVDDLRKFHRGKAM